MGLPVYSKGHYYKMVDDNMVILGKGFVELFVDSHGNHRYFLNGMLHKEDGPALITPSGYKEYYIRGRHIHPVWLETRKDELGIGED